MTTAMKAPPDSGRVILDRLHASVQLEVAVRALLPTVTSADAGRVRAVSEALALLERVRATNPTLAP